MVNRTVRILLLADTHLGFDYPFKPRVERRRRGQDFFANYERALQPALNGQVDLVVHGGDLLFRTKIHDALLQLAMEPLLRVADKGIPVYIVPGNHERSRIPLQIWTVHPNLHIFHEPQTFIDRSAGLSVALSGFPFAKRIGNRFVELLESTGYREVEADIHLLCLHQSVEGAKVGPIGFTFRPGEDVIQGSEVPDCFDAVLSGHIHRSQVLKWDLNSQPMPAPVIYPGSVERTAFAERFEDKHYAVVAVKAGTRKDKPEVAVKFHRLPARPMVIIERAMDSSRSCDLMGELRRDLSALDPDTIVRVQISGVSPEEKGHGLSAARLREIVPKSMNISLRFVDGT